MKVTPGCDCAYCMKSSSTRMRAGRPAIRSCALTDIMRRRCSPFFVQHVELTFQIGCVCIGAEIPSLVVHNVVHMERVGHHGEGLVSNVHQEWLIAADVVDVVGVAKLLQDLERLW